MVDASAIMHATKLANPLDGLLVAIKTYEDQFSAHNALPDDADDETVNSSGERLSAANDALVQWRSPATSHEAALRAASLADRERFKFTESPVASAMDAAAIAFWRKSAVSKGPHLAGLEGAAADALVTAAEAAEYLRASESTLARWRSEKSGPVYIKLGGSVLYRVAALREFIATREHKGTRPSV